MIKIICIGKLKEKFFKDAQDEYLKRLSKYTKLEIVELQDVKDNNIEYSLKKERELVLKHIKETDNVIILDINAKEYSSKEFSNFIEKELTYNSNVVFVIGSSNGLDENLKEKYNKKISFSKLTFPHQLFRIILLEQIYRSFKIINNESYHK